MMERDSQAQKSEEKIILSLAKKSPQTWSELLKTTKLSSRTLKKALSRLREKGLVYRQVKAGEEYPPPVFYGLTQKRPNFLIPSLFYLDSGRYVWGFSITRIDTKSKDQPLSLIMEVESEYDSIDDIDQIAHKLGRRLMARWLFGFLQMLKTKNIEWFNKVCLPTFYDEHALMFFSLSRGWGFEYDVIIHGKEFKFESVRFKRTPTDFIDEIMKDADKNAKKLEDFMIKFFPEEYDTFQKILKEILDSFP